MKLFRSRADRDLAKREIDDELACHIEMETRKNLAAGPRRRHPGAIEDIHSLQDLLDAAIWSYRLSYWISAALGVIALLLTLSGIYSVLSYVVAQRTKEIGIRIALGAGRRAVTNLVLTQCLRLAAIGIAIGSALALAAARDPDRHRLRRQHQRLRPCSVLRRNGSGPRRLPSRGAHPLPPSRPRRPHQHPALRLIVSLLKIDHSP